MSIAKCIADKTTKSDSSCVVADWNAGNASTPGFILNKPTIPAAQVQVDWNATSGVSSILNKPTIPAGGLAGVAAYYLVSDIFYNTSTTWVKPTEYESIITVYARGGSGAGGWGYNTWCTPSGYDSGLNYQKNGGNGRIGEYSGSYSAVYMSDELPSTVAITVGAGGVIRSASQYSGNGGGESSFGNYVKAKGGQGGDGYSFIPNSCSDTVVAGLSGAGTSVPGQRSITQKTLMLEFPTVDDLDPHALISSGGAGYIPSPSTSPANGTPGYVRVSIWRKVQ